MHVTQLALDRYPSGMPDFQSSARLTPEIPGTSIDPASSTVAELRQAMAEGRLTATALTQHYLDRIAAVNPALHAVIAVTPDAARAGGRERRRLAGRPAARPAGGHPGPGQGQRPGRGRADDRGLARAARGPAAGRVHRLPAARGGRDHPGQGEPVGVGELPVHPVDAAAGPRSGARPRTRTRSTATRPARARARRPASRPGFAALAVGTETDGSIVSPSSACGVVGIKPTLGLVSRTGIVPLSLAQDTAGPMAASVADAAALLSVLAAADPDDLSAQHRGRRSPRRSLASSTTPRSSTRRRSRARGSASGGPPRSAPTPPPRRCSTRRWAACGRSARW